MIFINYRRIDSTPEARSLKIILDQIFGSEAIFFDSYNIETGEQWPQRLEEALNEANALLIVIGPNWLKANDSYGFRLLDKDNDWVRIEIEKAIENQIEIFPLLVAGATLPPKEALPNSIKKLCDFQFYELRDTHWKADINPLIEKLEKLVDAQLSLLNVKFPEYCDHVSRILTPQEVEAKLTELKVWEIRDYEIPNKRGQKGTELIRKFEFQSFLDAISFMYNASSYIDKVDHHPRWENVWVTLIVHLSTWNIGHKVSALDFSLAFYLEELFQTSYNKTPEQTAANSSFQK